MPQTAEQWNERYRGALLDAPLEPAEILAECLSLLPAGPALDLACGAGRNTLFLAGRPQSVTAADYSAAALEILESRARAAGHPVERSSVLAPPHGPRGAIRIAEVDLERARLPENSFELILCFQYLQRSLFRGMEKALRPGGFLLFETYTRAQVDPVVYPDKIGAVTHKRDFPSGPQNPNYLLAAGELRTAFPSLETLLYRELRAGKGIATLLARRPGV